MFSHNVCIIIDLYLDDFHKKHEKVLNVIFDKIITGK